MVACLYLLLAVTLHGGAQLVVRAHRAAGLAGAGVLVVAWHVREHLRPAGTVPSLGDPRALGTFLVSVSIPAVLYALLLARTRGALKADPRELPQSRSDTVGNDGSTGRLTHGFSTAAR